MNERGSPILYPAFAIALVALRRCSLTTTGPAVMGSPLVVAAGALAWRPDGVWRPAWQLLLTGVAAHGAAFC